MYIDIADKDTLDRVKQDTGNLIDRVGVTNNTGATVSSGTLMGKANKIIGDLGTVNSNISTINTNIGSTSASGGTTTSGSVMAKLNKIVGNTNTLVQGVSIVKRVMFGTTNTTTVNLGVTIDPSKTLIFIQNELVCASLDTTFTDYVKLARVTAINSTSFNLTSNKVHARGSTGSWDDTFTVSWQLIEFY